MLLTNSTYTYFPRPLVSPPIIFAEIQEHRAVVALELAVAMSSSGFKLNLKLGKVFEFRKIVHQTY